MNEGGKASLQKQWIQLEDGKEGRKKRKEKGGGSRSHFHPAQIEESFPLGKSQNKTKILLRGAPCKEEGIMRTRRRKGRQRCGQVSEPKAKESEIDEKNIRAMKGDGGGRDPRFPEGTMKRQHSTEATHFQLGHQSSQSVGPKSAPGPDKNWI